MEDRDTLTILKAWCDANRHHVAADGSVYEPVAAMILDRAPNTLSNWRVNGGMNVPFYRTPPNGRVRYRLRDLADFIDGTRVTE
jgi:hypothetical protein